MKRYKVHYKVYKGDGDKRAFSINNGTYYGRLQGDAFWREAFRGLRLRGHQSLAAVLSYLGVRIAHVSLSWTEGGLQAVARVPSKQRARPA